MTNCFTTMCNMILSRQQITPSRRFPILKFPISCRHFDVDEFFRQRDVADESEFSSEPAEGHRGHRQLNLERRKSNQTED